MKNKPYSSFFRYEGRRLWKRSFYTSLIIFTVVFIISTAVNAAYAGLGTQYVSPQVLIVLDNSQSMDGDLSGAIMTGSGTVTNDQPSSSPVNYAVPAGFTAPVTGAVSGNTPYTVCSSGTCTDNSASRLNVAKEAILDAYNKWQNYVQFGLMVYGVSSSVKVYTTWVYYMSGTGGFTFGTSSTPPSGSGLTAVPNPCYNLSTTSCNDINSLYSGGVAESDPYLYIQDTSDEPDINDVLYAGSGLPDNFVTYESTSSSTYPYPNPKNPYPPNYSLTDYNNGQILETYDEGTDKVGVFKTGPTNAGYVPYSPEVWYSERGFGYYSSVTNNGNLVIPIAASSSTQQGLFASVTAPETNSSGSGEIKSDAVNAPMAGTLAVALSYLTGNTLPATTCPAKKYVIFVTDGLPTYGTGGHNWPPIGSAAATGYGVTATFNSDGSLKATNDNALSETITAIENLKAQGIDTYVIGMGAGVNPSLNPQAAAALKAMAVAGGTTDYFPATTPAAVVDDLGVIIQTIVMSGSYTTPVIHEYQGATFNIYYSDFIALNQPLWGAGNIYMFTLNGSGQLEGPNGQATNGGQINTSDSYWGGGTGAGGVLQTELPSSRYVITSSYDTSTGLYTPIPLNPVSSQSSNATLETMLGLTSTNYTSVCPGSTSESACAGDILNFILNPNLNPNSPWDGWKLGAIYHSSSVLIGPPAYPYSSSSYQAFKTEKSPDNIATREQVLVAGANDGMLHGFDAGSYGTGPGSTATSYGYGTGAELFGYIPSNFFTTIEQCPSNTNLTLPKITCWYELSLAPSTTNFLSYYSDFEFVDSTPYVSDVFFNNIFNGTTNTVDSSTYAISSTAPQNSWHTVLVGGERNGDNYYYAVGLTNPANVGSTYPDPLWTFTDAGMGATWSEPYISYVCLSNPDWTGTGQTSPGYGFCANNPNPPSPLVAPQYVQTYAAFAGGGYSPNNAAGNAVYALYVEPNPVESGNTYSDNQILWEFNSSNDSNMKYSIPSTVAPYPSYGELQAFYVGDLGGQMWAFNIPADTSPYANNGSSNWTGCRLFSSDVSASSPSTPLNIFYPPALSYDSNGNLWIFFGTGNAETLSSYSEHLVSGTTTPAYNEFIAINTGTTTVGMCPSDYNESELYNATGTSETVAVTSNSGATTYQLNTIPSTDQGWYITLATGEKVIGSPKVVNGVVYFTTYTPASANNACGVGTANIYALNYLNGGGAIISGTSSLSNTIITTSTGVVASIPSTSTTPNSTTLNATQKTPLGGGVPNGLPGGGLQPQLTPTSWFQLP